MENDLRAQTLFVIGGTNKAGTTSVFRYLSDHPEVCGSSVKETAFFIREYTGEIDKDQNALQKYFSRFDSQAKVLVEASTGYLAEAERVVPRIRSMGLNCKIMFILRNPVDRLYSYYNFYVGLLSIPKSVTFEIVVDFSLRHENGELESESLPFEERHLRALRYGRYADYLALYCQAFSSNQVNVMLYDDLKADPREFMKEICHFINIDEAFYSDYTFGKSNVTFSSRNKAIHKMAVLANRKLEGLLRQRPALKDKLVMLYKKLNMARQGYSEMPENVRATLREYYEPSLNHLESLLGCKVPVSWW